MSRMGSPETVWRTCVPPATCSPPPVPAPMTPQYYVRLSWGHGPQRLPGFQLLKGIFILKLLLSFFQLNSLPLFFKLTVGNQCGWAPPALFESKIEKNPKVRQCCRWWIREPLGGNVKTSFRLCKQNSNLFIPLLCGREQQTRFCNIDFTCGRFLSIFLEPQPHGRHHRNTWNMLGDNF